MAMQLDQLNGLACELKQMDNAPVSIGQVVAAEGEALRIQAPFDFPPDLAAGTKLKLTATAPDGSFSVLAGNVVEVGGSLLTLHGLNNVKEYGQRRFFRVDVNIPGEIRQEGLPGRTRSRWWSATSAWAACSSALKRYSSPKPPSGSIPRFSPGMGRSCTQ